MFYDGYTPHDVLPTMAKMQYWRWLFPSKTARQQFANIANNG